MTGVVGGGVFIINLLGIDPYVSRITGIAILVGCLIIACFLAYHELYTTHTAYVSAEKDRTSKLTLRQTVYRRANYRQLEVLNNIAETMRKVHGHSDDVEDGANIWLYDIIDEKTRFMLASRIALSRTTDDARKLMESAAKCAGKHPSAVRTDKNYSYLDSIELAFGADTEHRLGSPFTVKKEDSTSLIERFHGTLKSRTKVMRGLKSISTAIQFADGFLTYYNYLRPHEKLDGMTPAEVAGIDYPLKTWADIIRNTEPKVEVLTTPAKVVVVSEQAPLVRPITHRHYRANRPRLRRRKSPADVTVQIISPLRRKP